MMFDSYGSAIIVNPEEETTTDTEALERMFGDILNIMEQHPEQKFVNLRMSKTIDLSMLRRYEWVMEVEGTRRGD